MPRHFELNAEEFALVTAFRKAKQKDVLRLDYAVDRVIFERMAFLPEHYVRNTMARLFADELCKMLDDGRIPETTEEFVDRITYRLAIYVIPA